MSKPYCTCKVPNTFAPLYNPYTGEWSDIFVHSTCRLPTRDVWLTFIGVCDNCFKDFSFPETLYSPWGPVSVLEAPQGEGEGNYLCARCFRAENGPEPVYRGWKWASKQVPDWFPDNRPEDRSPEIEAPSNKPLDNLVGTL